MGHDGKERLATSFEKHEEISAKFSDGLAREHRKQGIGKDRQLQVSVFAAKETALIPAGMDNLDQLMQWAVENGKKISFYHGGISWNGDIAGNKTERSNNQGSTNGLFSLSSELSPEEKHEGQNKLSALEFLKKDGADIVITLEPKEKKHISSLRADMIARRFLYQQIPEEAKPKVEAISWSNGGFKDYQLVKQAFEKVFYENDKEPSKLDKDEAFATQKEAWEYINCLKDMHLFWGGAPAQASELAVPFKLTTDRPGIRELNDKLRFVTNRFVAKFGESNLMRKIIKQAVVSRLLEMGGSRSLDRQRMAQFSDRLEAVQNGFRKALGDGQIVNLLDLSGSVVEPTIQALVSNDMHFIFGDEKMATVAVNEESDQKKRSLHREIGEIGVLEKIRSVIRGESDSRYYLADVAKVSEVLPRLLTVYGRVETTN